MSFFDEVETTVANTRMLQAIDDSGPVVLQLKPIAHLAQIEASTRAAVTIDLLLTPQTIAQYVFKQFLCSQQEEDSVHLLQDIEAYRTMTGQQRRTQARKVLDEHPPLSCGSSNTAASLPATTPATTASPPSPSAANHKTPGAAYAVSEPLDAAVAPIPASSAPPIPSALAPPTPTHGQAHPLAPQPSTPTPGTSSLRHLPPPEATAPWPCLELILAQPPSSHPCCAHLASHASRELEAVQLALSLPTPPLVNLFDPLFAAIRTRLEEKIPAFLSSPFFSRLVQLEEYASRPPQLSDFRVFRVLGRGAFGAVSAVQKIDTRALFAMKEMDKRQVKADSSEAMVLNEKKVLSRISSPFVLQLKYSFHEDDTLYLVFDLCAGGDLKYHLRSMKDRCFDAPRARFYAAEILLGLESLHSLDIVYRDLKPNNILLKQDGHVVISDLGLTIKLRKGKLLKHLAGTAGYWSPEIMSKAGTYKSSDYWSFGVLLYEMLTGRRPQCTCDKKTLQWCPFGQKRSMEENALNPQGVLRLDVLYPPDKISSEAREFLEAIFVVDPVERLGGGLDGIAALKNHPYFAGVDWEALASLKVEPPFVPDGRSVNANSIGEVGEFNKGAFKHVALTPEDEAMYEQFKYVSPGARQRELVEALAKMDNPNHQTDAAKDENTGGCCTIL